MEYIKRLQEEKIKQALKRDKSVLLLGPRQTGKTTLVDRLKSDLQISFVLPDIRQKYEKNPSLLIGEIEALSEQSGVKSPLVVLDEVQRVPSILDVVQSLIDSKKANFILTGSSARKLRRSNNINLLPGRIVSLKLDPLTLKESAENKIENLLLYGSLPGIALLDNLEDREVDLESYVTIYLEEEVRAEALVRNIGPFARFLEYAAIESGRLINYRKLSQEIGVSHTTICSYFQILEDCLIIERIEPITKSYSRKKLTKTSKYLFFDLGVRRIAAREGVRLPNEIMGHLFEQFVGLELLRYARIVDKKICIRFWRDLDGPEVDWVIDTGNMFIPIEVKWTDSPTIRDAKHLNVFLSEYENADKAYLVCRVPRTVKLAPNIYAVPWQKIDNIIS